MIRRSVCFVLAAVGFCWSAHAGPREDMLAALDVEIAKASEADRKPLEDLRAYIESVDPFPGVPTSTTSSTSTSSAMASGSTQMAQVAAPQVEGGLLGLEPDGPSVCPGSSVFFPGQSVHVTASGFEANTTVDILFGEGESDPTPLTTMQTSGSGALDDVVTIPANATTSVLGALEAHGSTSSGSLRVLTAIFGIAPPSQGDSDGDGIPDICDNCPNVSNSSQENADLDELGDACDACPNDPDNDHDGDGVCADLDQCPFDADDDLDADGLCADEDNCPAVANPSQLDVDGNGVGDACQTTDTCSDGIDNDGDSFTDFPADTGCTDPSDTSETDPTRPCDDGVDNDADALADYRPTGAGDPGCGADTTLPEDPECDDGQDNDGDGMVDWDGEFGLFTPDPDCNGVGSTVTELPEPGGELGLALGALAVIGLGRVRAAA